MTTTAAPATAPAIRNTVAVWFEIPAGDYERAIAFYETVLGTPLKRVQHGPHAMAVFPYERPGISGCIVPNPGRTGTNGPLLFLNADGILDEALERVYAAGGRIELGRTEIGEGMGWFARIIDTEGNRVGLHTIS
jgi:predicted enzyme related to lactoylglutathione lyase